MYRKRLVCAAYAQMNITEDQTRRLMYIGGKYDGRKREIGTTFWEKPPSGC